ncbi:hormogonium polysaccharide secretion pseudopilin HpsC [Microcoleus sp. POL10_C6]|uniref:hormogonium polysaccharide secretion pseudopilin HpsC n=1 Tax=Microcoleus sp. POL10_C6 TaxID=2818852 RepID=UPI002FD6DED4
MKTLLRLLLKTQHPPNRSGPAQTDKGMTLVELLVGAIMAFLIITPMLGFVVDMLNTDRREQVKSNTEQDLQAAVDFIAQDLSQAIYIYNGTEIDDIKTQLPAPPQNTTGTPILVFWKRQQIKNAIPLSAGLKPSDCKLPGQTGGTIECNDTYVRSLVAYYQIKETGSNPIWCQPSGGTCPTRIERYEIKDGVKNPYAPPTDPDFPYYAKTDTPKSSHKDEAFSTAFDFSEPTKKVTLITGGSPLVNSEVLVNYIDHSPKQLDAAECQKALGTPQTQRGLAGPTDVPEGTLRVTDSASSPPTNSFYACVDNARNLARVTIRGNSLRRLQTNADYDAKKAAYFPTASVQVQGLGARGN